MKAILLTLLCFGFLFAKAQSDYQKIDPRRFVSIYEFNEKNKETKVWSLNCELENSECEEGKIKNYINLESQLRIRFDHKALSEEEQFYGNISLRANVGSNDVEVSPYFLIGEKQKSYGVDSKPIKEIATNFIRLFKTSQSLHRIAGYTNAYKDQSDPDEIKKYILGSIEEITSAYNYLLLERNDTAGWRTYVRDEAEFMILEMEYDLISYSSIKFPTNLKLVSKGIIDFDTTSVRELRVLGEKIEKEDFTKAEDNQELVALIIENKERYTRILNLSKELLKYMNFFKESGSNSMDAFLNISLISEIEFSSSREKLKEYVDELEGYLRNPNPKAFEVINKIRNDVTNTLDYYSTVICDEWNEIRDKEEIAGDSLDMFLFDESYCDLSTISSKDLVSLTKTFAVNAGREIYNKLVYGTIDLNSISFSEANRIEIDLVWYTNEEGLENGKILPLTSFYVKKMGWELSVLESMQLINRINGDEIDDPNYPISPSVFKPTPGAAFLWTFNDSMEKSRFWKWLEPSFGINLTYLDFNRDKDFEFGIGPMMGLFHNKIHFTWGANLNEKDEKPFYLGVGFSFSKVLTSIGENEND